MISDNSEILASSPPTWSGELGELTLLGQHDAVRIYKAQQYGRWYVFKSIKNGTQEQIQRLQKEFAVGVMLDHPHIVHTLDYGHHDQLGDYIRMEWIDGMTLADFMATHPNQSIRLRILDQLLDALQYMHEQQIVHRDLKPTNILITHNGNNLKLIDFGLADSDDSAGYKQPAGTLSYIAPEQLRGEELDARSDIYSVGKIMQWMFPTYLLRVARACVRHNPEDRCPNVAALRLAIQRRQRLGSRLLIGLLTVGLLLLTSYVLYFTFRPNPSERMIRYAQELVNEQYEQICAPRLYNKMSNAEWSETILLFYQRCAQVRDSVAVTIDDLSLRADFINTMVIETGQRASQFKKD